jgi:hypothetical protein
VSEEGRHHRTPVATGGGVAVEAEDVTHQRVEQLGGAPYVDVGTQR